MSGTPRSCHYGSNSKARGDQHTRVTRGHALPDLPNRPDKCSRPVAVPINVAAAGEVIGENFGNIPSKWRRHGKVIGDFGSRWKVITSIRRGIYLIDLSIVSTKVSVVPKSARRCLAVGAEEVIDVSERFWVSSGFCGKGNAGTKPFCCRGASLLEARR